MPAVLRRSAACVARCCVQQGGGWKRIASWFAAPACRPLSHQHQHQHQQLLWMSHVVGPSLLPGAMTETWTSPCADAGLCVAARVQFLYQRCLHAALARVCRQNCVCACACHARLLQQTGLQTGCLAGSACPLHGASSCGPWLAFCPVACAGGDGAMCARLWHAALPVQLHSPSAGNADYQVTGSERRRCCCWHPAFWPVVVVVVVAAAAAAAAGGGGGGYGGVFVVAAAADVQRVAGLGMPHVHVRPPFGTTTTTATRRRRRKGRRPLCLCAALFQWMEAVVPDSESGGSGLWTAHAWVTTCEGERRQRTLLLAWQGA